jgi:phage baseplate assembly protein W
MPVMNADFLGKGWSYPVWRDQNTGIAEKAGEDSVEDSIWIILATAPGERVMRPDFGCGIHQYVFALDNATTIGQVTKAVREALIRWEPRIDVLDVDTEVKEHGGLLLINVHYRVRATNNFFNLVYPFYLRVGSQG